MFALLGARNGRDEREAGYFWHNHWVPMPKARDLDEFNARLLECA
jgi:hypothetical protein